MARDRARFDRRHPSTVSFRAGNASVTVEVVTPRIVRVALEDTQHLAGPSHVADRKRQATPFDVVESVERSGTRHRGVEP